MELDIGGPGRYRLRYLGDPILTTPGYNLEFKEQIPDGMVSAMFDVCRHHGGQGLSAHQVGVPINVALLSSKSNKFIAINPIVETFSKETDSLKEGCLSIPNFWINKQRNQYISLLYKDQNMIDHKLALRGLDAQCALHELDHLQGILLTTGLSRQLRRQAERLVAKHRGQ